MVHPPGGTPFVGSGSGQDPEVSQVYMALEQFANSADSEYFREMIIHLADAISPSSYPNMTVPQMQSAINAFLGSMNNKSDVWMHFAVSSADSTALVNTINSAASNAGDSWTCTGPPYTTLDGYAANLYADMCQNQNNPSRYALAQNFLQVVQDAGSDENLFVFFQNIPDILTQNQYNIFNSGTPPSLADFQDVMGCIDDPPPPFMGSFVSIADWYFNQSPNGGTCQRLGADLMEQFADNWTSNSSFTPTAWIQALLDDPDFVTKYPGISASDFQAFTAAIGYAPGAAEFTLDQLIVGPPPLVGDDLRCAQDILGQINSGGMNGAVEWFNKMNASTSDVYLTYPNLSDAVLQKVTQLMGVAVPQRLPVDLLVEQLQSALANVGPGTKDAELFQYFISVCQQYGSNSPLQNIEAKLEMAMHRAPPLSPYQPLESGTVSALLSFFPYKYTLEYCQSWLVYWSAVETSPYSKQFAVIMKSVMAAYAVSNQDPSAADLQKFLFNYFSNPQHDLSFLIPGLSPFGVFQFFTLLNLPSPYPPGYNQVPDTALAGIYQALLEVSNPPVQPDYDALVAIMQDIKQSILSPDTDPYQNVLNAIQALKSDWGAFQPGTRTMLQTVLNWGTG
jgi:hypothetical protein